MIVCAFVARLNYNCTKNRCRLTSGLRDCLMRGTFDILTVSPARVKYANGAGYFMHLD